MAYTSLPMLRVFLDPISKERPSGDPLEYDPAFVAMERAASGREEQQFGQTVIEEKPPQWSVVRDLATELTRRTHDLRVGVYLAEAVIESDGIGGFTECLELLATWLENEWETVHPQLEADDQWDPTIRLNSLIRLTDSRRIVQRLRAVPMSEVRGLGTVTIGDLAALAETTTAETDSAKETETALTGGPIEPFLAAAELLHRLLAAVNQLDRVIVDRVGIARSVEFAPLKKVLRMASGALSERLQRRGVRADNSSPELQAADPAQSPTMRSAMDCAEEAAPSEILCDVPASDDAPRGSRRTPHDWEIQSREDVTAALDRLCVYFAQHEPSSPIPLLLGRAKRLVPMGFLEILQELGPDFLAQAQRLPATAATNR